MTAQPDGSALFGCNASDVTWMMSCDGDKWTGVERTCDPKNIKTGLISCYFRTLHHVWHITCSSDRCFSDAR